MTVKYFLFIRHGKTQSNVEQRYAGDPREPLCAAGRHEVKALAQSGVLPSVAALMSSPALRCRQTAELLFPHIPYSICQLAETDFGIFKGKNAGELANSKEYGQWLDTGCTGSIPGGDDVEAFKKRCCEIFAQIAQKSCAGVTALVIHGGNIMAILERYVWPKEDFYTYQIPTCGFFLCQWENSILKIKQKGGPA